MAAINDGRRQMMNTSGRTSSGVAQSGFSSAAMAKRTVHTTEQKVMHNNVFTRTTTVVEESVMRVQSSNGRVPSASSSRSYMQNQRFSRVQEMQKVNRPMPRNRSLTDEVITLD